MDLSGNFIHLWNISCHCPAVQRRRRRGASYVCWLELLQTRQWTTWAVFYPDQISRDMVASFWLLQVQGIPVYVWWIPLTSANPWMDIHFHPTMRFTFESNIHSEWVVSAVASQQEGPGFESRAFLCGVHQVLWLPPTVQEHACLGGLEILDCVRVCVIYLGCGPCVSWERPQQHC